MQKQLAVRLRSVLSGAAAFADTGPTAHIRRAGGSAKLYSVIFWGISGIWTAV